MARKIVLISCVSKKLSHRAKTKEIYISTLFKLNLNYAQSLHPDKIYVLSAKHGLLDLDTEIDPYNQTLNSMSENENKAWAESVLKQLGEQVDLKNDHFVFLAGQKYRKNLVPVIKSYEIPLEGLTIGRQLQFLKRANTL